MSEVGELELAYNDATARCARLVRKGQEEVREALRRLQAARAADERSRAGGAATSVGVACQGAGSAPAGSSAEFAGAAVVEEPGGDVRALSDADRFEQAAFEAALAGVDVEDVAGKARRRAFEHREVERLVGEIGDVVDKHRYSGDALVRELALMMRRQRLGVHA